MPSSIIGKPGGSTDVIFDDVDGIGKQLESKESTILPADCANSIVPFSSEELKRIGLDHGGQNGAQIDSDLTPVVAKNEGLSVDTGAPGVGKILKFAIPAIGVWLCGPLLSLIDTSAVGLLSGTAQQAALNPAVAITDYSALLLAFMFTATTNLVASAQEADRNVDGKPRTTKTLIASLQLSGFVGTGIAMVLIAFCRTLVRTMIGNDSIDPEVFSAAMNYIRIRALGLPAAAIIGSAQSACLGLQDIKSPLYVLLAAAVVNFLGDVVFVGCPNPLIGGAAGAAWATVFSQYAALAMFMKWLRSKPRSDKTLMAHPSEDEQKSGGEIAERIDLTNAIMEMTGSSSKGAGRRRRLREALLRMSPSSTDTGSQQSCDDRCVVRIKNFFRRNKAEMGSQPPQAAFSTRGFLEGRLRKRDLFTLPPKDLAMEFWPYVIPVTTTSIGRVSSYAAMSHVVASSLGTVAMAAQQVVLSLFYCLTPIADSLSLTAQSFVPGIYNRQNSPERAMAMRSTTNNFYKAGGIFGAFMLAAVACIPLFSKFFTSDPMVISMVNSVAPYMAGFFAVHGMFMASEGIILGQKDLNFLGKSYAAFFAVVPILMLQVKKTALSGVRSVNLASLWKVFVGYQLFRFASWGFRLFTLHKRIDNASKEGLGDSGDITAVSP